MALQALGGCDRRGGRCAAVLVFLASGALGAAVTWRLSGCMESAITGGCLAALLS